MPETPRTSVQTETFPAGTKEDAVKKEQSLKMKAQAISSVISGSEAEGWTLTTTWNVIGEDDDEE